MRRFGKTHHVHVQLITTHNDKSRRSRGNSMGLRRYQWITDDVTKIKSPGHKF